MLGKIYLEREVAEVSSNFTVDFVLRDRSRADQIK